MLRRILVGDNERVLLIRNKRFSKILGPGDYWLFVLGSEVELERYNIKDLVFNSQWANYLVNQKPELTARYFTLIETGDEQVAVVYLDGKLARVLAPSSRVLYWRGDVSVTSERIDIRQIEVPERLLSPLAKLGRESQATFTTIDEGKRGLVFVDGRMVRELEPGTYGFWNGITAPRIEILEMRPQTLEVAGQEILTKDKVTVRVNISAVFEIVDARVARSRVKDVNETLYRTLQIAVRKTLGMRTLEEMLVEKTDLDQAVAGDIRREMETFGVRVGSIAVKDIILPGDIRDILNQVVTAEKQAQANLIRRREETAATRSLLNTAKLMEDNPLLVRMKELESLEKIADKVGKITVVGGLNTLLERTVTIKPE
jgi:regulator of protease activity HflC (stomatin/prohibitin superfamily)